MRVIFSMSAAFSLDKFLQKLESKGKRTNKKVLNFVVALCKGASVDPGAIVLDKKQVEKKAISLLRAVGEKMSLTGQEVYFRFDGDALDSHLVTLCLRLLKLRKQTVVAYFS